MREKIICPYHSVGGRPESTPSLVIYDSHFHCFSCSAHGPLSQLGMKQIPEESKEPPENIDESLYRINNLELRKIRGLPFRSDADEYYIVWPYGKFYKARKHQGDAEPRYRCPRGVPKPLLVLYPGKRACIIVEGEINAISLAQVVDSADGYTIVSPGSASEFASKKYLPEYASYSKIVVVADKDRAGAAAIIKLKPLLLKTTRDVTHVLVDKDFNDRLVQDGQEKLRAFVEENLGLPKRLQRRGQEAV